MGQPEIANGNFCLYAKAPASSVPYTTLGQVKLSRGTYGGVRDELPVFVTQAKAEGGDAIISYNGAQRFGFWPWRFVHPVLTGTAIKWTGAAAPDCVASGGSLLATVLTNNQEPPRH